MTPSPPLVSCLMPTFNRRNFIPYAIQYFLVQEYPAKELIILDDGEDMVKDLIPESPLIRYMAFDKKLTLGRKLNIGCAQARGDIIAHWDDDDWYDGRRISYQADSLLQSGCQLCGINDLLYYNLVTHLSYNYQYPAHLKIWLSGSSLCYRKELWEKNKFADIDVGMDGLFVWNTRPEDIIVLPDNTFTILFIHPNNVSPKKTNNQWWSPIDSDEIKKILNKDWDNYQNFAT